jgi:hypothetical protein
LRKCINNTDLETPSYGFEGIWFINNDDVAFLVEYMKSLSINNDTIKERLNGLCDIKDEWFQVIYY